MADQDDEFPQDETPEPEQRLFTLTEAERARRVLEPFLVEAIECRKKLSGLDNDLSAVATRIMMMGCVIKDLDVGRLDCPSIIDNEEVYLCWKLGEDRIRYYHRQDEGFAGRKPIDPRDTGPGDTVQ